MDKIVILGGLAIISGVSLLLMDNEKEPKKRTPKQKKSPTSKNTPESVTTPLPTIRKTIKKSVTPKKERSRRELIRRESPKKEPTKRATNIVQETVRLPPKPVPEIPTVKVTRPQEDTTPARIQLRRAPSRSRSPTRSRSPRRSRSPTRSILKRASTSPRRVYSPTPSPTPPPLNIPRGVLRRSVSDTATVNSDRGADTFYREETRPLTDEEWEEANVLTPTRTRRRSESRN